MSEAKAPAAIHPTVHKAILDQDHLGRISIFDLSVGDEIEVRTKNSNYFIKIVELTEKRHRLTMTSTNKKYPGPYTDSFLVGTTIFPGCSIISPGMFAVGGLMEVVFPHPEKPGEQKELITSAVASIHVNGTKVLPLTSTQA